MGQRCMAKEDFVSGLGGVIRLMNSRVDVSEVAEARLVMVFRIGGGTGPH